MRVDMSRDGELHRLIRIFLDYELPEIQEFRHAQSQFKTDLPTVLENPKPTVEPPARYTALLLEALIAHRKGSAGRAQSV